MFDKYFSVNHQMVGKIDASDSSEFHFRLFSISRND